MGISFWEIAGTLAIVLQRNKADSITENQLLGHGFAKGSCVTPSLRSGWATVVLLS